MEVMRKEVEEKMEHMGSGVMTAAQNEDVLEDGLGEETESDYMDTDGMDEYDPEEVKSSGTFVLTSPLKVDGEEVKKLHYDFGNVTPIQYINICKKISKKESLTVPELNMNVQFTVFCRAAGMPVSVLKTVDNLQDFTAMCQLARDFLLSKQGDSDDLL